MFNNDVKQSNVKQDIIWVAEYLNGTSLYEFIPVNNAVEENSFYDIDASNLSKFGLVGCNHNFWFDVGTGVLYVNDQPIEIKYNNWCITNDGTRYEDIITYKDAEFDVVLLGAGGNNSSSRISNYHVGYKKSIFVQGTAVHYKLIFDIPTDGKPVTLDISISADKDLNGNLCISRQGVSLAEFEAPIRANTTGNLKWVVK